MTAGSPGLTIALAVVFAEREPLEGQALPPALVPILGKPVLDHTLDELADLGVPTAVVVVAPGAALVRRHLDRRNVRGLQIEIVEATSDSPDAVLASLGERLTYPYVVLRGDLIRTRVLDTFLQDAHGHAARCLTCVDGAGQMLAMCVKAPGGGADEPVESLRMAEARQLDVATASQATDAAAAAVAGELGELGPLADARPMAGAIRPRQLFRAVDLSLVLPILLLLSPWLLLRAIWDGARGGPVLSRTRLQGRDGRIFRRLGFRSDCRGRSLPALINVLRGEMGLVGPRPRAPEDARPPLPVRPGLVVPADVRAVSGMVGEDEALQEQAFIDGCGLRGYLGLLVRGVLARAAYGSGSALPTVAQMQILGIRLDMATLDEALNRIFSAAPQSVRVINFANPHCLNIASEDPDYRAALAASDAVFPDGSGLKLATRLRARAFRANLNGTDLFPRICERAARQGWSVYLLGARPGVAQAAAENMRDRYPALQVAGCRDGYFAPEEEGEVVAAINAARPDLLFVAMGVPAQEHFVQRHRSQLQARAVLGVGGLFDYYSGRIPRAPVWLRELGLEWVWRLLQEPRRMWRRYIVGNPVFLLRIWREQRALRAQTRSGHAALRLRRMMARFRMKSWHVQIQVQRWIKRSMDVAVAGGMLLVLSPFLGLLALAIKLESPGPVLFSQTRIGRDGRSFRFWKFRSMYRDAEARKAALMAQNEMAGGVIFKMKRDPRITRIGRVIRRLSIDELPQLWNVLAGDMTLVGPRPPVPQEVAQYTLRQRQRLSGTPGLTCEWQVAGRSDIPFEQQVEMDIEYLHDDTVARNLRLLVRTVPAVLSGRGAY